MINKTILTGLLFFITITTSNAQDAEIKDNKVLLNGKAILKYEKVNLTECSIYSLNDDEIILYRWNDNETPRYQDDDYFIINFLTAKKKVESKSTRHVIAGIGLSARKNMQKMINWLLKEKVLDSEGNINLEKLDIFFEKYNENITERTIR